MNKNSRGFTLIELLAIIVILGILAVIIIPKVTEAIENSERSAAIVSATGYRNAINQYYVKKIGEPSFHFDGDYTIGDNGTLIQNNEKHEISFSGAPPIKGWVEMEKGEVKYFSLKIGKYIVSLTGESDEIVATKGDEPI